MRANKLPVPTEAQEQITLMNWAELQSGKYPELKLLYHVPNGGSRNKAEAGRLRAEGRPSSEDGSWVNGKLMFTNIPGFS